MFQLPEGIPAVNAHADKANEILYPNDIQQPPFLGDGSAISNNLLATLPSPNPFAFQASQHDSSATDPTTIHSSDHIPDPQSYQDDLFDPELDAIFSDVMLPAPAGQLHADAFFQYWDSWPS
jgi:hypothetical protein